MATNLSHHTCCFSDWPWPKNTDTFPKRSQVHEYLQSYAEHFGITHKILLNTLVTLVTPSHGKWKVKWTSEAREKKKQVFDYVCVCSGFFSEPFKPSLGLEGPSYHASEVQFDSVADQRVVVLGSAFSGTEMAVQLVEAQARLPVHHLFRRPKWIIPRWIPSPDGGKTPVDLAFYSRGGSEEIPDTERNTRKRKYFEAIQQQLFSGSQGSINKALLMDEEPTDPVFVTIADQYLEGVQNGCICPHTIDEVTSIDYDLLVLATGYRTTLPFLQEDTLSTLSFEPDNPFQPLILHWCMFHPELEGMAFIGMYRGPYFGIIELQARLALYGWSGKCELPSKEVISKGIEEEEKIREMDPQPQFPHPDYVAFADCIAKQCGVFPNEAPVKPDPVLPCHFRIDGFKNNQEVAHQMMEAAMSGGELELILIVMQNKESPVDIILFRSFDNVHDFPRRR
eukprot:CAMPEP_0174267816 /NCGR_PEP_ID=MMETSP0439-20130205/35000_1 /TAXON_ID=0 /ORGANISM="Stereomyxa ramosa, Strain Chinc5" /LENGTH=451 /DNA_ID=CAMNT_0015355537 /DNA_START=30 /DNA_END=1386 /DNA_ORIENTATION=-